MPCSCFILATPSLPNFMPLGFHSTINLLLSVEMSRSWWGESLLAWADHFFSAISPWWTQQSYHACTVKWSWCKPNGTRVSGGQGTSLWLQWVCWIGPFKAEGILLSLHVSLWFRVEFLCLKHRRPENSLVHTAWSRFLFSVGINSLCEENINVCVRTSLNSADPLV